LSISRYGCKLCKLPGLELNAKYLVGITGGIGSGKSSVCKAFEALGWPVYQADDAAKKLLKTNLELRKKIAAVVELESYQHFDEFRKHLAAKIFESHSLKIEVESLIHPEVAMDFENWKSQQTEKIVAREAAIFFETGSYKTNNFNILVIAKEEIRIKRVLARDAHMNEEAIRNRMASQWPDEKKIHLADAVIDNSGDALLIPQILTVYETVVRQSNT
jgi:dephospho-CoA kinase